MFERAEYTLKTLMHSVITTQPLPTLEMIQKICLVFRRFFDRIRCVCGEHGYQLADLHWDNIGVTSQQACGASDRSTRMHKNVRIYVYIYV